MQKGSWVLIITFFLLQRTFSQEKSISNQAYIDPYIINPACTGSEMFPVVRFSVDKQWVGFRGSPSTVLLSGNTRVGNYDFYTPKGLVNKSSIKIGDRVGFGGNIYYDSNGPLNSVGGMVSYAYHVPLNRISRLSMGISLNLLNKSLNTSELEPDQTNDDYLFGDRNDMFRMNFGIGLLYHTNRFFAGLSVNELFPMTNNNNFQQAKTPGYFLLAGYKFTGVIQAVDFEPSVIVSKLSDDDVNVSLFARVYYMRFHWVSLSYSTEGFADIMAAVKLYNSFYLGYNYIYTLGRIASYNYGSHRISLGINLGLRGMDKWTNYN